MKKNFEAFLILNISLHGGTAFKLNSLVFIQLLDLTEEVLSFNSSASLQAGTPCLRQHIRVLGTFIHTLHNHSVGVLVVIVLHVHSAKLMSDHQEPPILVRERREESKHFNNFSVKDILCR